MANDKKFVVKNGLTTQNIAFVDDITNVNNTINVTMTSGDTLSFSGDTGQLFSITDSLSGTIFAVNDISGVPSIEVDDDGTIRFAETFGNVLIGTATDDGANKLQLTGNAKITGNFETTGTVTANTFSIGGVDVINNDRELVLAKLTDINQTINDTAVDVFVYDTSKDSDGGAWRHRTQHTSWYNEGASNTRGSRKEFPSVAVIVAEADKITIYDGDDPSLPMWMVFNLSGSGNFHFLNGNFEGQQSYTSVSANEGEICVGLTAVTDTYAGLLRWRFVSDDAIRHVRPSTFGRVSGKHIFNLANRHTDGAAYTGWVEDADLNIVNGNINDVAMTVLPDAPADSATGLPVPTIAVATDGGVSVIKDDGTVVDSAATLTMGQLFFDDTGGLFYQRNVTTGILWYSTRADYEAGDGFGDEIGRTTFGTNNFDILAFSENSGNSAWQSDSFALGGDFAPLLGLMLHQPNYTDQTKGMSSLTTSDYATGWMPGDIKLAALADTTAETLSGSDLVTEGSHTSIGTDWSYASGVYSSSGAQTVGETFVRFDNIGIEEGKVYSVSIDVANMTQGSVAVKLNAGEQSSFNTNGTHTTTLVGTSNDGFQLIEQSTFDGSISNISVRLADPDRSVNGNGLGVHGSVTKEPVATGADLVAYSGFNTSNYLEQPYNPDLDFGADGDFSVMGWAKRSATGSTTVLMAKTPPGTNTPPYFEFQLQGGSEVKWVGDNGTSALFSTSTVGSVWKHIAVVRSSGVATLYINGNAEASSANTDNYDHSNTDTLRFGLRQDGYFGNLDQSIALWRISATAPTADQIAKIYNDEKVLFQENAKATLTGSSDAVTALAHDPDTDLLHVGTSGGRSVFQGLRRVEEHTGADNQSLAAISAVDGLVVEGK